MGLKIWSEMVTIPTYEAGARNKNPMFLEKRVYQGSSGRVYPWPVIDKIGDEKVDREYNMVFIENEYVQVQIMPEIGGRIYRAIDKTNDYDFVYYNKVIKPALVGLTGPWISGGIEFNWPQHHRPNTYGNVEYQIDDSKPDSKTVWLSETDRMYGTKVTTGITLREEFSAVEIKCSMYNPTSEPQTFLWWANPAVVVHDETQSIFPPDVHAVMDHGKRDVSKFPIATGTYYKMDYSKGVDISRYKNIPVPTSYMAYHSDYDFVGGYDYRANAGILHVADHHVSPGKKQWTWGCGDFGKAWDRNLTDEDGPYIELMTGVFTDNQPDFTWLAPGSCKTFTQYFMPYKGIAEVKSANKDIAAALNIKDGKAVIGVYAAKKLDRVKISLSFKGEEIFAEKASLTPEKHWEKEVPFEGNDYELTLNISAKGVKPVAYSPAKPEIEKIPDPAKAIGSPETLENTEALLLAGLHLEQYRHATYDPEVYYLEGLKRDPGDIRLNNAYGNFLLRRGYFEKAQKLFETGRETATRHSPNPYDGEVFFNLGKALELQGDENGAFDAYFKAIWSDAWRSQGYLKLAQIAARRGDLEDALEYAQESLWANYKNFDARGAVTVLNRVLGNMDAAQRTIEETQKFDPMDLMAASEAAYIAETFGNTEELSAVLGGKAHNAMLLAGRYMELGRYDEAVDRLDSHISSGKEQYAMAEYMLAYAMDKGKLSGSEAAWQRAGEADSAYCFPSTALEYNILLAAIEKNPKDAMAHYYLGCFMYDKKRYKDAKEMWSICTALKPEFPTAYRNLSLYYANKEHLDILAVQAMEKAFALDKTDSRVFYELCDLYKKTGKSLEEQCACMEENLDLVHDRDDLCVAYAEVLNGLHRHQEVIDLLMNRNFHPWEGGEGKVPTQHIEARLGLARELIANGKAQEAISHLEKATVYYENFGEGKLAGAQENNIYYNMGLAYKSIDAAKAKECFERAAVGLSEPSGAMYYNDQPPHMIFYQGLALKELCREDESRSKFNKLVSYGEKHIFDTQSFDYFAVSLPDFMVFDRDLNDQNRLHCNYMIGLGYMGLGETQRAQRAFDRALEISPNHYGVKTHKEMLYK